jgi:hypothetical protein
MSYSPGVGLILNLDLDASSVDSGINDAEKALGGLATKTGEQFVEAGKKTDDALLSNRESVRLLGEEFGIHLPRAVSGAISEMLPDIGTLSTGLLGVFAVEEVYKFGKAAVQALHDLQGETKELAEDWKRVIEAQEKLLEHPGSVLEAQERVRDTIHEQAETQARIVGLKKQMEDLYPGEAAWAIALALQLREQEALERKLQERLVGQQDALKKLTVDQHGYNLEVQRGADSAEVAGQKRSAELRVEIAELGKERDLEVLKASDSKDKQAAIDKEYASKRLKLEHELSAELAHEAEQRARKEQELLDHAAAEDEKWRKLAERWHKEWLKAIGMPEEAKFSLEEITRNINSAGLAASKTVPSLDALTGGVRKLTEAERAALPASVLVNDELLRTAQHIRDQVVEIEDGQLPAFRRIEVEYARQVEAINLEIAAQRREYEQHKITRAQMEADEKAYSQAMVDLAKQRQHADEEAAEATAKGMAADIATFVGSIAGRKAEAEVEGAFFLAEGAYDVARGAWPPNPALVARGLGEIGAGIDMLKAAGKGGRSASVGHGGGGAGMQGGRTGPEAPGAMGTEVPITPGFTSVGGSMPGGNLHVAVFGESAAATWLVNTINKGVMRQGLQVQTGTRPKAGR